MIGRRTGAGPAPAESPQKRIDELTEGMTPGLTRNVLAAAQTLALREMRLAGEQDIPIEAVAMVFLVAVELIRKEILDRENPT